MKTVQNFSDTVQHKTLKKCKSTKLLAAGKKQRGTPAKVKTKFEGAFFLYPSIEPSIKKSVK